MDVFVGELPPPYGGVAVKDKLMYQEIYKPAGVKMLDLVECKRKPWKIPFVGIRLIYYILLAEHLIIGVGTNGRIKVLLWLRHFLRGKKGIQSTQLIAMGGMIHHSVCQDASLNKRMKLCRSVWVETRGMQSILKEQGYKNVHIFPNCRTAQGSQKPRAVAETMRYVYFSRICAEKGVDVIAEALEKCNGSWTLDFYGEIAAEYRETFERMLKKHPEVRYHGVFDSTNGAVYEELNQYDMLLLPSSWKGEGVPGALIESKMAGIAACVSDWNFNSEIVIDGVEGIVLHGDLAEELNSLTPQKLMRLKEGAYQSRNRYEIKTYKERLLREINR